MKTAAFAIAGSLTVVSKTKKTKPVGALWNEKNILDKKSDWSLAYLEKHIVKNGLVKMERK